MSKNLKILVIKKKKNLLTRLIAVVKVTCAPVLSTMYGAMTSSTASMLGEITGSGGLCTFRYRFSSILKKLTIFLKQNQ